MSVVTLEIQAYLTSVSQINWETVFFDKDWHFWPRLRMRCHYNSNPGIAWHNLITQKCPLDDFLKALQSAHPHYYRLAVAALEKKPTTTGPPTQIALVTLEIQRILTSAKMIGWDWVFHDNNGRFWCHLPNIPRSTQPSIAWDNLVTLECPLDDFLRALKSTHMGHYEVATEALKKGLSTPHPVNQSSTGWAWNFLSVLAQESNLPQLMDETILARLPQILEQCKLNCHQCGGSVCLI